MSADIVWRPARGGIVAVATDGPRTEAEVAALLAEWADDRPARRVPWEGGDQ